MTWESAADRVSASCRRVLGQEAQYTPPAGVDPVSVRGFLNVGDADPALSGLRTALAEYTWTMTRADVLAAAMEAGGLLTVGGREFDVQRPRHVGTDLLEFPLRPRAPE